MEQKHSRCLHIADHERLPAEPKEPCISGWSQEKEEDFDSVFVLIPKSMQIECPAL